MEELKKLALRHKADGTPYATVDFGRNVVTGKRNRRYKEFPGMTDDEALAAAREWAAGEVSGGTSMELGDQLALYVAQKQAQGASENTLRTYRNFSTRYVAPILGLRVDDVTPVMLNDLYMQLLDHGADGRQGLKRKTVNSFKGFLKGAYGAFLQQGLVAANPVAASMRISPEAYEGMALDEDSTRRVQEWIDAELAKEPDTRAGIMRRNAAFGMYLALNTGMRVGEVCALRRKDVRIVQRTVSINGNVVEVDGDDGVRRQDKTKGHRTRNIVLAEPVVAAVRAHERWQGSYLTSGTATTPICTADGGWMRPRYLSGQFRRMVAETGIDPAYKFHSLRHTHATWLLQSGVDFRTVQERLGHADPSTTLSIYAHVMPGRDSVAADTFQQVMGEVTS